MTGHGDLHRRGIADCEIGPDAAACAGARGAARPVQRRGQA
jgi:hypothetical protein